MLLYSAGLRVGEVVRLTPPDLDVERGLVRVRRGKGGKDRYTLLALPFRSHRVEGGIPRLHRPAEEPLLEGYRKIPQESATFGPLDGATAEESATFGPLDGATAEAG